MAIEVYQHWDGPEHVVADSSTSKLHYRVIGTEDDIAALNAAVADCPTEYNGNPRKSLRIDRGAVDGWIVEVDYQGSSDTNDDEVSFDTSGGTAKVTQSLQTIAKYAPAGQTAEDYQGAIGVTDSGIDGCDVVVAQFKFSKIITYAGDVLSNGMVPIMMDLTGKVNDGYFYGMAPGESLFMGCKGTRKGNAPWKLSFDFIGSQNRTGIVVGPITGITKKGHEYLWIRYEERDDAAAHRHVKRPRSAYVEKMYETRNFAALGIGVS